MSAWFAHETAVVDDGAEIGAGTRIWHFTHVSAGAEIGPHCVVGQNVFIGPGVKIGSGVSVYSGVTIADDVFLGPSCVFTNVSTPRAHVERKDEFAVTSVGRGATVGANATVVCGHALGEYSLIGAGAVVVSDVVPHAVVVGNPARRVAWACRCGESLPSSGICRRCGDEYEADEARCRWVRSHA